MIVTQAQITIANRQVSIAQDNRGCIYCFKHNSHTSDWDYFEDLDSATDFIFSELPNSKYIVSLE